MRVMRDNEMPEYPSEDMHHVHPYEADVHPAE